MDISSISSCWRSLDVLAPIILSRTLSLQDEITVRTIDVTQIDNLTDPLFNSCYDYYYYYWYTYLFSSFFYYYYYFMQYDSPRTLLFLSLFNCPRLRHYCSTPPTLSSFSPLTLTLISLIFFSRYPSSYPLRQIYQLTLLLNHASHFQIFLLNLSFFRSLSIFSHALFLLLFLP